MNTWTIVPVKPLNRGKSRLEPVMDIEQREAFNREMLSCTLETLKAVKGIAGILVVSRDPAALALARQYDVHTVQESGSPELNTALTRATNAAVAFNARNVLIVPADIPLMQPQDIEEVLEKARNRSNIMLITTDHNHNGTNILLVNPPGLITYRYGEGSFERHVQEGQHAGLDVIIHESDRMSLDIDTPQDLELYRDMLAERDIASPSWLENVGARTS